MPDPTTAPSTATEPTQDNPESASSTALAADVAANQIVLDRTNLRESIRNLQRTDPDFANIFGDLTGRNAQRTWQPKVSQLEAELKQERMLRRKYEIEQMPAEEIDQRFASDPKFATEVAELVHYTPTTYTAPAKSDAEYLEEIKESTEDFLSWARAKGLPKEAEQIIAQKATSGGYDQGESFADWRIPFSRFQADITEALVNHVGRPVTAPAETPAASTSPASNGATVTNPAITRGSPDLSAANKNGTGATTTMPKTAEAFNNLPRDVQKQLYLSDPAGVQKLQQ